MATYVEGRSTVIYDSFCCPFKPTKRTTRKHSQRSTKPQPTVLGCNSPKSLFVATPHKKKQPKSHIWHPPHPQKKITPSSSTTLPPELRPPKEALLPPLQDPPVQRLAAPGRIQLLGRLRRAALDGPADESPTRRPTRNPWGGAVKVSRRSRTRNLASRKLWTF